MTSLSQAFDQAESLYRRGLYPQALGAYRGIVQERLDRSLSGLAWEAKDLVILERMAELCVLCGEAEAAELLLASGVRICLEAEHRYGADCFLAKWIQVLLGLGRVEEARQRLREWIPDLAKLRIEASALATWEKSWSWPEARVDDRERKAFLVSLYRTIGRTLAAEGFYGEAVTLFRRGLAHTGEDAPAFAQRAALPLRLEAAGALLEKGELAEAGDEIDALENEIDGDNWPGFYVRWLERRAELGALRGDLSSVLNSLDRAREHGHQAGLRRASGNLTLHLAQTKIFLNQTAEAETLLSDVRQQALDRGDGTQVARADFLLALAQARRQVYDGESFASVHAALRDDVAKQASPEESTDARPFEQRPSGHFLTFFEQQSLAFEWYLGRGESYHQAAAQILEQMRAIFGRTDSRLIQTRLQVLGGRLLYFRGDFEAADEVLSEAVEDLRELDQRELWQAYDLLASCRLRASDSAGARRWRAKSEEVMNRIAGSLPKDFQGLFQINKWTQAELRIGLEVDALIDLRREVRKSRWWSKPFKYWRLLRQLDAFLARITAHRDEQTHTFLRTEASEAAEASSSLNLLGRLWRHPKRRATFAYVSLPDRLVVVRAIRSGLDLATLPLSRVALRDKVRTWHQSLERFGGGRNFQVDDEPDFARLEPVWHRLSEELAEDLLPPALGVLPKKMDSLTLVPDDALHGFPFAALRFGEQCLAERFRLSIDHRVWPETSTPEPTLERALLIGVSRSTTGFPALPGVGREIAEVAAWTGRRHLDSRTLFNEAAGRETVLDAVANAQLWHVACHGTFVADAPEKTGLVLLPQPDQPEVLSLPDLASLNLDHLSHATLASCWGADHFVFPGRWVLSLPEVLRRAGAGSVLACLWPVDDQVAIAFMRRFYRHLSESRRDEALFLTRRECLRNQLGVEGVDTSKPYYWAGFQLYGKGGNLPLPQRGQHA